MWFKGYIARKVRERVDTELRAALGREREHVAETKERDAWRALKAKYKGQLWRVRKAHALEELSEDEVAAFVWGMGDRPPELEHVQIALLQELIKFLREKQK